MGLEPMTRFISATVSTSMGDVELCHVSEMVAEEQKDFVRVGATVSALCQLSGDAAAGEYAGGVVFGEDQDLVLLRDFFLHGGAQRLRSVMHSECRYSNDYAGVTVEGARSSDGPAAGYGNGYGREVGGTLWADLLCRADRG